MNSKEFVMIDQIPVEINDEKNLLELIRKAGIKMPTFCYHSELSIYGACRMCMIETENGGLEAACSTPPKPGMQIRTNTDRLRRYRKMILELLLANHCRDCTTCANSGSCKLQDLAKRFHIEGVRFPNTAAEPLRDESSAAIVRDRNKCILCGDCVRMCNEIQNVGAIDFSHRGSKMTISTAFDVPITESTCVGCGQCAAVCPTGAIVVKNNVAPVWRLLDDPDTHVTVQIAPAVRVAVNREFGLPDSSSAMGRIVAALRRIGFDEVYDTSTGADLTVMEEAKELLSHLESNSEYPLFTSCCPSWVKYCEKKYPDLLSHVSTCRSPMQMFASVINEYGRQNSRNRQAHIAVMPCTAKKEEARIPGFSIDGVPNVDYVLSTQELIQMIRESGVLFSDLEPEAVDLPFGTVSGSGVLFGVSGGVTEAVLRRVASEKTAAALHTISYKGVRGMQGVKNVEININGRDLRIAVVSGLRNASDLIDQIKAGEHYDFVEVMACPGGCVSGAGQPFAHDDEKEKRGKNLYSADRLCSIRRSEDNPLIETLYKNILRGKEKELLHR